MMDIFCNSVSNAQCFKICWDFKSRVVYSSMQQKKCENSVEFHSDII